jgi:hypothetical protein
MFLALRITFNWPTFAPRLPRTAGSPAMAECAPEDPDHAADYALLSPVSTLLHAPAGVGAVRLARYSSTFRSDLKRETETPPPAARKCAISFKPET